MVSRATAYCATVRIFNLKTLCAIFTLLITWKAKLLNADWSKKKVAKLLNADWSMKKVFFFLILLVKRVKLLAHDWSSVRLPSNSLCYQEIGFQ